MKVKHAREMRREMGRENGEGNGEMVRKWGGMGAGILWKEKLKIHIKSFIRFRLCRLMHLHSLIVS